MNFLDLFSGIGGFRLALEAAGHTCVGHIELDKFANRSYEAIHAPKKEEFFHDDITTISEEHLQDLERRNIDIITGGFPCQAFSIAGERRGFEDTRGTLFFDILRFADRIRPRVILLENVRGLLSHDKGRTFETILKALEDLRYNVEWQVLNSKNFGVPQNRERVFIVGHSRDHGGREILPIGSYDSKDIGLQGQYTNTITAGGRRATGSYVIESQQLPKEIKQIGNLYSDAQYFGGNPQRGRVYDPSGLSPTLSTMQGGGREPKIIVDQGRVKDQKYIDGISDKYSFAKKKAQAILDKTGSLPERFNPYNAQEIDEVSPTLTASCDRSTNSSTVLMKQPNFRIRKLTPKECWRLQGFPDWAFERAKAAGVSDSQLYKQAGNAVTVNVVFEIAKRLSES